jgi:hypothetical protein
MALHLSDGSTIKVTANHPFYVDAGPGVTHSDWVEAGKMQVGDKLRSASWCRRPSARTNGLEVSAGRSTRAIPRRDAL